MLDPYGEIALRRITYERIELKCDPNNKTLHMISMHVETGIRLNKAFCRDNALDYCWEQAQRPDSQLNRNSLICDLNQRRILQDGFAKG